VRPSHRATVLIAGSITLLAAFEIGAAWTSARLRSRRTVRDDVRAAIALSGPRSVLIVGNSLVLHGIDVPAVEQSMGVGYTATKLAIVDSGYLDWVYGLASLFDRGSQPDAVVLAISPTQLVEDRPPTGAAARMVWTAPNLLRYAMERRPGLTATSDRMFEHLSEFFAVRSRLRNDARRLLIPGYERMARELFVGSEDTRDTARDERVAEERLRTLREECAHAGARFVYLLIPTHTTQDVAVERAMISAGTRTGVPVLAPVPNGALDSRWLLDGYHLNAAGASAFSARAGAALSAELARSQ
jgi:hypothetical protein